MPGRIDTINRIVARVGIQIDAAFGADGIVLEEAAERRGIGARAVEVEPGFFVEAPACVAVRGGRRAVGDGLAKRRVGVLLGDEAGVVGERDDGTERILEVIAAGVRRRDAGDWFVDPGGIDEAASQRDRAGASRL